MKFNDETGPHQVAQLSASETGVPAMKFTYATGDRPLDGYTIKRGIGSGGFGEVYYATSEGGKQVALKMVRRHLDVELRGVNQCLNLKHPNLVVLYDVKQGESGDCWVIMEYMSGESLAEVIARHPRGMPSDQAVAYLRGICEGVSHLHTHGIVHRDLKPGNVFTEDGSIKVGDYGLAKFMSVSRRSGQTESVGTVHYMAPELSQGRYGKEIDLYAVGIMLYEMLTGRVPFEGESAGEILMKHLTAEPDLSRLAEPYRSVVARALAKDPLLRYPSMQAMLEDLDARLAMPAGAAPRWAAAPRAAQVQPMLARHAAAWSAAGLNKARALADRQLLKRFASLVARLLIAIFFGVGAGLLLGGISLRLLDDELSAAFAGAGAGTLTASILLILLCGTVP
ncbi:MAG: serine/threonine-protein kinase, partial [Pirellulales bacterium]